MLFMLIAENSEMRFDQIELLLVSLTLQVCAIVFFFSTEKIICV